MDKKITDIIQNLNYQAEYQQSDDMLNSYLECLDCNYDFNRLVIKQVFTNHYDDFTDSQIEKAIQILTTADADYLEKYVTPEFRYTYHTPINCVDSMSIGEVEYMIDDLELSEAEQNELQSESDYFIKYDVKHKSLSCYDNLNQSICWILDKEKFVVDHL